KENVTELDSRVAYIRRGRIKLDVNLSYNAQGNGGRPARPTPKSLPFVIEAHYPTGRWSKTASNYCPRVAYWNKTVPDYSVRASVKSVHSGDTNYRTFHAARKFAACLRFFGSFEHRSATKVGIALQSWFNIPDLV